MTTADLRYLLMRDCPQAGAATNPLLFLGLPDDTAKPIWVTGGSRSEVPTYAKRYYQSASCTTKFVPDGFDITPPADGTFTINALRQCGGIPLLLTDAGLKCRVTVYEVAGKCLCLDDLCNAEWDYVRIRSGIASGPQTETDGNNEIGTTPLVDSVTFLADEDYFVSRMLFRALSPAAVPELATHTAKADVFYGNAECSHINGCGCVARCASGTEFRAKLLDNAGAGVVAYSTDDGNTWNSLSLPTVSSTYNNLIQCGNHLVATYRLSPGGYVVIPINTDGTLGAPVNYPQPGGSLVLYDAYCLNGKLVMVTEGEVYIADMNGNVEIVDLEAQGATSARLITIDGCGSTLVAAGVEVGALANGVVVSQDGGETWTPVTNPPGWGGSVIVRAVHVHSPTTWDIGLSDGTVWRTTDGGQSWELLFSGAGVINDIFYPTSKVGWLLTTTDLFWTLDCGNTWCSSSNGVRLDSYDQPSPSSTAFNLGDNGNLAAPISGSLDTIANNLMVSGNAGGSAYNLLGSPITA